MRGSMRRPVALVILAGGLALILLGAGTKKEEGIRAKRGIRSLGKVPRFQLVLPRSRRGRSKKAGAGPRWVFQEVSAAKERDQEFWTELVAEWEGILKDADDPDNNLRVPPEGRKQLQQNIAVGKTMLSQLNTFYGGVRMAVEDAEDPTTSLVVKTGEIRKDFTIQDAVNERKAKPPPWRLYRVERERTIHREEPSTRFKKWQGQRLHVSYKSRPIKKDEESRVLHDMVYLYRRVYKQGSCYLVEIHCRWQEGPGKKAKFAAAFDTLLRGFLLLDR
jgi:hypothetical protein